MRVAGLALVVAVGVAPAAHAEVVARSHGYVLEAERHGGLCLTLRGGRFTSNGSCGTPPTSPFHPLQISATSPGPVGLAVPATVAQVDIGGRRVDTVAASGFGSRFALIARADPELLMRMYDASGTLIGAARNEDHFSPVDTGTPVFRRPFAAIRAVRTFELEPNPLELDRTVPETCVSIQHPNDSGESTCTLDRLLDRSQLSVEPGCGPRAVLYGLVEARARRATITLGSGRALRVRTRALPPRLGPGRLLVARIPRGEAVRFVRAGDAFRRLGVPPTALPCSDDGVSTDLVYAYSEGGGRGPVAAPVTVAEAGGHALRAADGPGTVLCIGIDTQRRESCETPPVDAYYPFLRRSGDVLFGVLSRDVATVEVVLASGRRVTAQTTEGPAYTGRYAGLVRFVALTVPAGSFVKRAVLRDGAGRRLGRAFADEPRDGHPRTRPLPPGLELERSTYHQGARAQHITCVRARHPQSVEGTFGICSDGGPVVQATATVACHPRRAVLFGTLPRHARGVVLSLAGGSSLRARVRAVRGLGRLWTAVVPRPAKVTAMAYPGSAARPLRLLPAARQCGYDLTVFGGF
jgi:hypothetical protein